MTILSKFIVMNKNSLVHSAIIPIYCQVNVTAFAPYQFTVNYVHAHAYIQTNIHPVCPQH